jgi:hypothetical protein
VTVPATALAQSIRRPAAQERLARLNSSTTTDLRSLDAIDANSVGILLGVSRTRDIAHARFVNCAKRTKQTIVTSDPDDLLRLDVLRLLA